MKVVCQPKVGKRDRLDILVDDSPWREVHTSIFGFRPELPPTVESEELLDATFLALEYKKVKLYTLNRLAAKSYGSGELALLLRRRLVTAGTIEKVVDEFRGLGYVNDGEWTASFVRRHWARGVGPQAIGMKLRAKGVAQEAAEVAIREVCQGDAQHEAIRRLVATKYKSRNLSDFKEKQKVIASLIRKGFDYDAVVAAL